MWAMLIQSHLKTSEENILHFQAGNFPNKFLNVFAALVFRGSYNVVFAGLGLSETLGCSKISTCFGFLRRHNKSVVVVVIVSFPCRWLQIIVHSTWKSLWH